MKRSMLSGLVVLAMALAACGGVGYAKETAPGLDGFRSLLVETPDSIRRIDAGTGAERFALPGAIRSPDGGALYAVHDGDDGSALVTVDPASGREVAREAVGAGLEAAVAAPTGRVALVATGTASFPDVPSGRTTTPLEIVDPGGRDLHLDLDGNFEPEAFSTDGDTLFLISYLPAAAPTHYEVTKLNLAHPREIAQPLPVPSPDKVPASTMQGERIQQVLSPEGDVLYTLYLSYRPPDVGQDGAFVHVLNLEQGWAHCIDLPVEFSASPSKDKAIAISADGTRVYVTDAGAGQVAEIETEGLSVWSTTSVDLPRPSPDGSARAAMSADDVLWVGGGPTLARFRTGSFDPIGHWRVEGGIDDLLVEPDGSSALVLSDGEAWERLTPTGRLGGVVGTGDAVQLLDADPMPVGAP